MGTWNKIDLSDLTLWGLSFLICKIGAPNSNADMCIDKRCLTHRGTACHDCTPTSVSIFTPFPYRDIGFSDEESKHALQKTLPRAGLSPCNMGSCSSSRLLPSSSYRGPLMALPDLRLLSPHTCAPGIPHICTSALQPQGQVQVPLSSQLSPLF